MDHSLTKSKTNPSHGTSEVDHSHNFLDVCSLDSDPGRLCSNWTIYWAFNSTSRRCQRFYYGGCDGNGNRFENQAECRLKCFYSRTPGTDFLHVVFEMLPDLHV
ncbi:hypothetical protein LOTGIDRAFT_147296 [Lottia gigantea]|uniref:BPTI/Kunitz inhibitor domain-containing protein n=1 Tax=Lottia gigantea TaxID=225164 RepID=V4AHF5_LOTGI|nr:hypothetical protein LOTGIDRAFT_147296 [Lottia gigantea]ESO96327.1 hypothetical protein LOTGIDRAFT_147296 [Lottia gigantea]